MSSLTINGKVIFSTSDSPAVTTRTTVTTKAPSWDTHHLVDGNWVLKGSVASTVPTPVTPKPAIGFAISQPTPAPTRLLGSRKEYLREIEIAAGKVLLAGTNTAAIEKIRRGRLGGRKDNMAELAELLREYSI